MTYVSTHFQRHEIACKCGCGFDSMDVETLILADEVRDFVDRPTTCSSGCRCVKHNKDEKGGDYSQHLLARAMDLEVDNPEAVYDYLCNEYPNKYGFGLYSWGVHIDTRSGGPARW